MSKDGLQAGQISKVGGVGTLKFYYISQISCQYYANLKNAQSKLIPEYFYLSMD